MSDRFIQGSPRGSMSSDTTVKSSSESVKKSREKYEEESVDFDKNPRMQSVENSSATVSDVKTSKAEKYPKQKRNLGEKIKNTWKEVKEKFSDKSGRTLKTKMMLCQFEVVDPSLSKAEKTKLWQKNGRSIFSNLEILKTDFDKSRRVISDLLKDGDENSAANKFNTADYAGLGFDFSATMVDGKLLNPMNIFCSKSVITSTKTTPEELLADIEDQSFRTSYALNKPIHLCASGIGPVLFTIELLKILRDVPL